MDAQVSAGRGESIVERQRQLGRGADAHRVGHEVGLQGRVNLRAEDFAVLDVVVAEQGSPSGRGGPERHGGDVHRLAGLESGGGQHIHRNGGPEAVLDEEGTVLVHEWAVLRVDRDGILDGGVVHARDLHIEFCISLHTVREAPVWEARGDRIGPRVGHVLEGLAVVKGGGDGEADVKLTFGKRFSGFVPRSQVV